MNISISLRIKVFMIAICFIVAGQIVYSIRNVESFQTSYLESLREKCRTSGELLKSDVEFVLNLNIPITKLVKLEKTLQEQLNTTPELEFIEITDLDENVLYYADHTSIGNVPPGTRRSRTTAPPANQAFQRVRLSAEMTDTTLPVYVVKKNQHVGYIKMRLSSKLIVSKSREILLDMITVILTSLLITFEFLTFFVTYSISEPLDRTVRDIGSSLSRLTPLPTDQYLFMDALAQVVHKFNAFLQQFVSTLHPFFSLQNRLNESGSSLTTPLEQQQQQLDNFLARTTVQNNFPLKAGLERMRLAIVTVQERLLALIHHFSPEHLSPVPAVLVKKKDAKQEDERTRPQLPYIYIRPVIFLIIMADGFSISFFPLYVDQLYTPMLGLSKEVILGLPISLFMLSYSISMPIAGGWSDRSGWKAPLLFGLFLDTAGLVLTAMSRTILHLLLARVVTAIGFGLASMASQQFVIKNTSSHNRTQGMTAYVAAFFGGDICGTVIGGMLADRIGYHNVFLVSGLFSLLAFLGCLFLFKAASHRSDTGTKTTRFSRGHLGIVLKDWEFVSVITFQAIPSKIILIGFLYYFVPLYLKQLGTLQSNIGRVIMCYGIMLVFLGTPFSKIFYKEAHKKYYILAGGLITGGSMLIFQAYSGFLSVVFLVAMLGIAHTFSVSSQASYITETQTFQQLGSGTGMALFRSSERIGSVFGPLIVGTLIARYGYDHSVILLGSGSLVCSLLYLLTLLLGRIRTP